MSYLVFARKWRPRDFDEVVGQDHVTKTLKSAIRSNKLAHAYLFAGPQGVGKTSCARILAKAMNCEKGPTDKPCGVCSACRDITEGRSLDVIEIDGASNRGIDEIRTLRENVKFAPLNGRHKIYIIDEVHMLTQEAFNALLKTLEEPPPFVKFVFATTNPQKVLPTILSRCQRFDFVRIPNLKIVEKLKEIAAAEKLKIADDVFFAIARAAEGSMRDAESILDQLVSFSQKDVQLADVVMILGIIEQEAFISFVDHVAEHDAAANLQLIARVLERGKDMNYFLEGLLEHYRNLMVLKIMKSNREEMIDLPADVLQKVAAQADRLGLAEIMVGINHILAAQDMAKKLNSARIPLEVLAVKLSTMGQKTLAPRDAVKPPQAAVLPSAEKPAPLPRVNAPSVNEKTEEGGQPLSASAQEPATCTLEDVKNRWDELIESLSKTKMSLATYLKEAVPVRLDNGSLTIGFPKSAVFFKEAMAHRDNLKIFETTLSAIVGASLRAKLDIVEGLPGEEEKLKAHIEDNPVIQSALDLFKGKVVKRPF